MFDLYYNYLEKLVVSDIYIHQNLANLNLNSKIVDNGGFVEIEHYC